MNSMIKAACFPKFSYYKKEVIIAPMSLNRKIVRKQTLNTDYLTLWMEKHLLTSLKNAVGNFFGRIYRIFVAAFYF